MTNMTIEAQTNWLSFVALCRHRVRAAMMRASERAWQHRFNRRQRVVEQMIRWQKSWEDRTE